MPGTERRGLEVDWRGWVDDRMRGFPTGHDPLPADQIGGRRWRPQDGRMALPLLSLAFDMFEANATTILDHLADSGTLIAPHARTPMSVSLARWLVEAGAWGATVSDARQTSVMLEGGILRLLLAGPVGGPAGARRLASLLWHHPSAEVHVLVDSAGSLDALATAWRAQMGRGAGMPGLGLMVELGGAATGVRTDAAADALVAQILDLPPDLGLRLTGIAACEDTATPAGPPGDAGRVDALIDRVGELHARVRQRLGPSAALILSAGGSAWFDRVLARLGPVAHGDGRTRLMLRSGAVFFGDNGACQRGLAQMVARGTPMAGRIGSALRVWAEVVSLPEPGLAVLGLGLRDVATDQGLPVPLRLWRDGLDLGPAQALSVAHLTDQQALAGIGPEAPPLRIGDVVEFGLSHPCTNFDRHRLIWVLGDRHEVIAVLQTDFG